MSETYDSVFDAICDTTAEAADLRVRAEFMLGIRERVRAWGVPREIAAQRLGLTPPWLDDLMRGKIGRFTLDGLTDIAMAAGWTLHIESTAEPGQRPSR